MSRPRLLAERVASARGVEKPTIVCAGSRFFYVRLPDAPAPVVKWDMAARAWRPFPFLYSEALARVARYYEEIR